MALLTLPSLGGIAFPQKRMPHWNTIKQDALSGKRTRYQLYSYPIYKYEIPLSFLRSDSVNLEWQTLLTFINSVLGATQVWQYLDPIDNAVTSQVFGVGDGTTRTFQLVRAMIGIGDSFVEPVFLPITGFTVSINAVPTVAFTQGTSNPGAITFNTAPASAASLTWTGSFYWPCRFDEDDIDFTRFMTNLWEIKVLKFSTEKLA
jgi:uncharacterized protein (TIGR02217 family)